MLLLLHGEGKEFWSAVETPILSPAPKDTVVDCRERTGSVALELRSSGHQNLRTIEEGRTVIASVFHLHRQMVN